MNARKYEKSFDNRCAALVSREGSASREGQNCKPCMDNRLRLISPLRMARGAQVSRAAREPDAPLAARLVGRFPIFPASQERRPPECGASECNIPAKCQKCCVLLHRVAWATSFGEANLTS